MLRHYSSRTNNLTEKFLITKLNNAISYDRIAGYFCSSVLDLAGEALEKVTGKTRIVCNAGVRSEDVKVAGLAALRMKQDWCSFRPEEVFVDSKAKSSLAKLYALLVSGKLEIKVVPDDLYGLLHGKAGVIAYINGSKTAFLGSINETKSAYKYNYEMVWEDDDPESIQWVQSEFDQFWNDPSTLPLSEFIVSDLDRLSRRTSITLDRWRETADDQIQAVAVEEPVFRSEFGLWAHQKFFVKRAFDEHQSGGSRLLLADVVGLGKTIQLAMTAKLIALTGDRPILIIAPKTLLKQWQDEMKMLLDMPSAIWTGRCWIDENGFEYHSEGAKSILKCPRRVGLVSQGLITGKSETAEILKQIKFDCVIIDEAHRARRRNLGKDADKHKAQPNNLLQFLNEITFQTKSMLLATATPIQIEPIEAFDLLNTLALPDPKILGDKYSVWRNKPQTGIEYASGEINPPDSAAEIWEIVRNPFPSNSDSSRRLKTLRSQLYENDDVHVLRQSLYEKMTIPQKKMVEDIYFSDNFVLNHNPYIRFIVRRTRDFLENTLNKETGEPYLKKIEVKLFGEDDSEALVLSGYQRQAYEMAERFCVLLSNRVKGGGFLSTLLLKRIGSTMLAGENTAKKMLSWTQEGKERLETLYEDFLFEDDEDEENEQDISEIRTLTSEEIETLELLLSVLKNNRDADPKLSRVKQILKNGVDDNGAWKDKGCIIFSQYFDSANFIAEMLSRDLKDVIIGLYAGGDKSGFYINGAFEKVSKESIKDLVKNFELKILVGTDAASEGLNLQMLSTLINVDLPWNPTRLEQRKGRIQRIGQLADRIMIFNMRYKDSVEDRVHSKLSKRLKDIFAMFGQIPEVLEDVWIAIAQNDEKRALAAINKMPEKNPFVLKYEMKIPDCGDWEKCSTVLDRKDKVRHLMLGW